MSATTGKRVLVVCQLDRFANGQKPLYIQQFLQRRGHQVRLFDTYYLSRSSTRAGLALYLLYATFGLLARVSEWARSHLSYYLYRFDWHLRRRIFAEILSLDDYDLVISETPYDAVVLTLPTSAKTLYDCPTPWADELYLEGRFTKRQHGKFRRQEKRLFESVDYLAFHWETYASYAIAKYGISGRNLVKSNWGCTPSPVRARYRPEPRIAYFGSLNVRFIDIALLARLSSIYPHIDVYGGPPPPQQWGLNYCGYATTAILEHYQAGLITCTKDELRCEGFSAKHLDYLAHGLPVLVPAWRRHIELLEGSIQYDEGSFLAKVEMLADEDFWQQTSDQAYEQAKRLAWDVTLLPLASLLEE
jgi:hypothetical protein